MGNLIKSLKKQNVVVTKSNNNVDKSVVQNTTDKRTRHEFKVLSIEDVNNNRSKAYNFLTF